MSPRVLAFLAAAALSAAAPSAALASSVAVDCPFAGTGDGIDRGFYIDDYVGTSLGTVTLAHAASVEGIRSISLAARLSTFDGTVLGVASVTRTIETDFSKSVFDFGDVPVAPGSRITFVQTVTAGAGGVVFDAGVGPCAGVTETEGIAPPLSTVRDNSVGVQITGDPGAIASATTFSCPVSTTGNSDRLDRGFYITNYPGVTIHTVTLYHSTDTPGVKTLSLIARLAAFNGPLAGVATTTRFIDETTSATVFDFGGAPVPAGSTITFEQNLNVGTEAVFFDVGFGPCENVSATVGIDPPLDTTRRSSVAVTITGRVASEAPVRVVEFFNANFGHYFMSADPDEIAALDAGAFGGAFVRTGQQFRARNGPVTEAEEVCRFFTVAFTPKSSHFYTADPAECAGLKLNPDWQYENIAFYIEVPTNGVCAAGTVPVYRLYNNGMTGAPNHRFTTSLAIHDDFAHNRGWTSEGVRFCALP
jgi:hypothetical protein